MTRYRPPRPKSAPYITPAGVTKLRNELKTLWKVTRPEVTRKVAEAAAQGDRSENADYIYGKKQLREIDSRVRYLSKRLDELVVVDTLPRDTERIYFGAWVALADSQGRAYCYRIVGPDEFDRAPHYISIDSPMARALLNKTLDDMISLRQGADDNEYRITRIEYAVETDCDDCAV